MSTDCRKVEETWSPIARLLAFDDAAGSLEEVPVWHRSAADELINAATHAFGFVLALLGTAVMMGGFTDRAENRLSLGCSIYLACLVAVYAMSTLSHYTMTFRWKTFFRQLDQGFIYLLIVATYTPFSLAYLDYGPWPWLLTAMWTVAIVGFVNKVFFAHHVEAVSIASYVLLGWLPVVSVPALYHAAPPGVLVSIFAGGICYTIGTLFLVNDQRVRHFHAVWHLCVIAGSACHFVGMLLFVVNAA